ncbi:MAG: DUF1508 domain-containing protein [Flavobacterium sp.]|nr:DUF1508 domain-containing protein [Flavobacterium sp.]
MASFVISKRFNGEYKFVFSSRKGKAIFTSNSFLDLQLCEKALEYLRSNAANLNFTKHRSAGGKYFFKVLIGEEIHAVSRRYTTELLLAKGISEIQRDVAKAEILDFSNDSFIFPDIETSV